MINIYIRINVAPLLVIVELQSYTVRTQDIVFLASEDVIQI
jgi:hypothetical protein